MKLYTGREIANKKLNCDFTKVEDLRAWAKDLRERAREASKASIYHEYDPLAIAYEKVFKELLAELNLSSKKKGLRKKKKN